MRYTLRSAPRWASASAWVISLHLGCSLAMGGAEISMLDQTEASGLIADRNAWTGTGMGWMISGGAVGDFNNDDQQDIFIPSDGTNPNRLFINHNGFFTNQAGAWGVDEIHIGVGAAVADYNRDGWSDIYVTSLGPPDSPQPGHHRLYRNNGDGSFTNVAVEAGVNLTSQDAADGFGAAWGDYDGDGWLDLFVAGYVTTTDSCRLFRNNGDGTFMDVTDQVLLPADMPYGFSPLFADMDGDGWRDLLVACDWGESKYFANNGDGTFMDFTEPSGTGLDSNGMGQTLGDFNNDGLLDWYVTSIYDPGDPDIFDGNKLYMNQGDHLYNEVAMTAGVADGAWGWGTVAVDLNHNGWQDIVSTNGWVSSQWLTDHTRVFRNNGDLTFTDVAPGCGLDHTSQARGLAMLDADNDGAMDIVVFPYDGPLRFYANTVRSQEGEASNWLRVFLDADGHPAIPPDGMGTIVRAVSGEQTHTRLIAGVSHYLSQSELSAHFGLGSTETVDELHIEWPNGLITTLHDVPANQTLNIAAPTPGDLHVDGVVDGADLGVLLGEWGAQGISPADLNADGVVDGADLGVLLGAWG